MRSNRSVWWVIGWVLILLLALTLELIATHFEMFGVLRFPSLSSILVAVIPLPLLEILTVGAAAFLVWHWWDMVTKWGR